MNRFKWLPALLVLIVSLTAHGTLFQSQSETGGTVFSDTLTPGTDAVVVKNPPLERIPVQVKSLPKEKGKQDDAATKLPYRNTTFVIISPKNEESIHNQPAIPVKTDTRPEPPKGSRVTVFMDGTPSGSSEWNKPVILRHVERGTHHLRAILQDPTHEKLAESIEITIYIHKASALRPAGRP